jgi:ABC-type transport system substrate-binding protein
VSRARVLVALLLTALAVLAACSDQPATPPPPPVNPTPAKQPTKLVVGVDEFPPGFNPHLVADLSPITTALATLSLPSVFRIAADGNPVPDPTIVSSATVSSQSPFTVSYELNLEASWSDNAPIAAEDFVYLWQQMRSQPGTVDAAGYRQITDVRSRAGGKAVEVVFAQPYPAWQHLFANLLPAHLVKDAPGSWIGATAGGLPSSGGPFKVWQVDRGRGEILLTRNDAYWDTPTVADQLVLRRVTPDGLASGLATGDVDLALVAARPRIREALTGLDPAPHVQPAPRPEVTQLTLRTDTGPLRELQVREALAALVDREAVRRTVAPEALAANAFGLAPSQPGYAATAPDTVRPDPAAAAALLTAAGWKRDVVTGRWDSADGRPARLVVAAAAERPDDQRVAAAVAAQLDTAGISSLVVAPPADALFGQATVPATPPSPTATPTPTPTATPSPTTPGGATSTVAPDIVVTPRPAGGDLGTELASDYGCATATPGVPDPPKAIGGSCLTAIAPLLALLLSPQPGTDTAASVERILWQQLPALPLFQPVTLVVSTPRSDAVTGVGPGPLLGGPLAGAPRWKPASG